MYRTTDYEMNHLPDPVRQPEFYDGVVIKRAVAWVIDAVLVAALLIPVVIMTAFVGLFFLPFLWLMVSFVYRWVTISTGSATWGMRMMAIELRDADGDRLDGGMAFLHTAGYTLSVTTAIIQLASVLLMMTTERGQGLSDLALGTVMINKRG